MVQNETNAGGAQPLIRNAITAIRHGKISRARALLVEATDRDPANGQAWLWRAGLAESPIVRRFCLERVIAVDPEHPTARRALAATPSKEEPNASVNIWHRPSAEREQPVQSAAYQAMRSREATSVAGAPVSAAVALRAVYVGPPASDLEPQVAATEPVQENLSPLLERFRRGLRPERKVA